MLGSEDCGGGNLEEEDKVKTHKKNRYQHIAGSGWARLKTEVLKRERSLYAAATGAAAAAAVATAFLLTRCGSFSLIRADLPLRSRR